MHNRDNQDNRDNRDNRESICNSTVLPSTAQSYLQISRPEPRRLGSAHFPPLTWAGMARLARRPAGLAEELPNEEEK